MKKIDLELDVYYDFESIFPVEYFEIKIGTETEGEWFLFYVDEKGHESEFGPFLEPELFDRIELAPFLVESLVFVYYLVESSDQQIHNLGVQLLKHAANL